MSQADQPIIFNYDRVEDFIRAKLIWLKSQSDGYSMRREVLRFGGISHTQVSRLGSGKRRLTRDLVEPLAKVLRLKADEKSFLDRWVKSERMRPADREIEAHAPSRIKRSPQNHLLNDWLNVYVKDAANLRDFRADPQHLSRLLGGIASSQRIGRSLQFLLREGFLRKTLEGRIVTGEVLVASSDGTLSAKIRAFHKRALAIAQRNIDLLPLSKRQESALVMHLNSESVDELRALLAEFYERLQQFAEDHPHEDQGLYQVLINFTSISIDS